MNQMDQPTEPYVWYRDREIWGLSALIVAIALVVFPPWLSAKCAGEWQCEFRVTR